LLVTESNFSINLLTLAILLSISSGVKVNGLFSIGICKEKSLVLFSFPEPGRMVIIVSSLVSVSIKSIIWSLLRAAMLILPSSLIVSVVEVNCLSSLILCGYCFLNLIKSDSISITLRVY